MEVKIDADELCELRKHNADLQRQNLALTKKIAEDHACSVDRYIKCDWDAISKERDWWRHQAILRGNYLRDITRVTDKLCYGQLLAEAEALGYKVPE